MNRNPRVVNINQSLRLKEKTIHIGRINYDVDNLQVVEYVQHTFTALSNLDLSVPLGSLKISAILSSTTLAA